MARALGIARARQLEEGMRALGIGDTPHAPGELMESRLSFLLRTFMDEEFADKLTPLITHDPELRQWAEGKLAEALPSSEVCTTVILTSDLVAHLLWRLPLADAAKAASVCKVWAAVIAQRTAPLVRPDLEYPALLDQGTYELWEPVKLAVLPCGELMAVVGRFIPRPRRKWFAGITKVQLVDRQMQVTKMIYEQKESFMPDINIAGDCRISLAASADAVYVAWDSRLRRFDLDTLGCVTLDLHFPRVAHFPRDEIPEPSGVDLAVAPNGPLFVLARGRGRRFVSGDRFVAMDPRSLELRFAIPCEHSMSGLTVVDNEIYAGDCVDFSIRVFSATGDPLRTIPVPSGWTQPTVALCWAENTLYIVEYCVKDMGYLPTSDDPPPRGFTPAGHPYPTKLGPQAAAAGCGVIAITPEGVVIDELRLRPSGRAAEVDEYKHPWPSCAFFNGRLLVAAERIEATKEKKIVALKGVGMRP